MINEEDLKRNVSWLQFYDEISTINFYDPDSSPLAWDYYQQIYDFDKLFSKRLFPNIKFIEKFKVYNSGHEDGLGDYLRLIKKNNYCELGGDTDFNFDTNKYYKFLNILKEDYPKNSSINIEEFYKALENLHKCHTRHHTLLNFSLMLRTGNINGLKGEGYKYDWLDRLDTFVSYLNDFYNEELSKRRDCHILSCSNEYTHDTLFNYLSGFDQEGNGLYKYMKEIYFIEDKELIKRLIKSGKEPIDSYNRVIEYVNLANDFWDEKKDNILKKLKKQ